MDHTTHNDHAININETFGVGQIECTYETLISVFGPPLKDGFDDYKCDAEWHIQFADGSVASIYNWKNGYNYLGSAGIPTNQIKLWNVGGKDKHALDRIKSSIMEFTHVEKATQDIGVPVQARLVA